jgi:hypothetical protein
LRTLLVTLGVIVGIVLGATSAHAVTLHPCSPPHVKGYGVRNLRASLACSGARTIVRAYARELYNDGDIEEPLGGVFCDTRYHEHGDGPQSYESVTCTDHEGTWAKFKISGFWT